jgi:hypothetical protein
VKCIPVAGWSLLNSIFTCDRRAALPFGLSALPQQQPDSSEQKDGRKDVSCASFRHPAQTDGRASDGSRERAERIEKRAGGQFLPREQNASQPEHGVTEDKRR